MLDDPAFWDMFRAEVDTHLGELNTGLLALERDPTQATWFDRLMRAAHSIKGAAKIMGLSTAVDIAHAIEDCFVAAREGSLTPNRSLIDALLQGVDLLERAAARNAAEQDAEVLAQLENVISSIARAPRSLPGKDRLQTTAGSTSATITEAGPQPVGIPRTDSTFVLDSNVNRDWVTANHTPVCKLLAEGTSDICFDFAHVMHVDAMGLAFLALAGRGCSSSQTSRRGRVRFINVPNPIASLLHATGVDRAGFVAEQKS